VNKDLLCEYGYAPPKKLFKMFRGNLPFAIAYLAYRTNHNPHWKFHPVEIASFLGVSRQRGHKLCGSLVKKGLLVSIGVKRIDIPVHLQCHGMTYYKVHEFRANVPAVDALMEVKKPKKPKDILKANDIISSGLWRYREKFFEVAKQVKEIGFINLGFIKTITRKLLSDRGLYEPSEFAVARLQKGFDETYL